MRIGQQTNVVFGAPGCGKTTRLLEILKAELKAVPPEEIAYVSFTRAGAYEGAQRAIDMLGATEKDVPFFRTLHSIAFRAVGASTYDMMQRRHYKELSDALGMSFIGYYTEDLQHNDDRYLFYLSLKRNNSEEARHVAEDLDERTIQFVEHNYERYKKKKQLRDFTDLIVEYIDRCEPLPVRVAIIDEAQDLTTLQWQMCEKAFANCERVYVAGDDDQAIYQWSGADVHKFLSIDGPREVLPQSYRIPASVHRSAQAISAQITERQDKQFTPRSEPGTRNVITTPGELRRMLWESKESWYLLTRNTYFSYRYKQLLQSIGLPYWLKEKHSIEPKHIRAINMFEKARKAGALDDTTYAAIEPYTGASINIGNPWYDNFTALESGYIDYLRRVIGNKAYLSNPNVKISTIHGVKGGEADNVVILDDVTRSVDSAVARNPDSELRAMYVALTRAKQNVYYCLRDSKNGFSRHWPILEILEK